MNPREDQPVVIQTLKNGILIYQKEENYIEACKQLILQDLNTTSIWFVRERAVWIFSTVSRAD